MELFLKIEGIFCLLLLLYRPVIPNSSDSLVGVKITKIDRVMVLFPESLHNLLIITILGRVSYIAIFLLKFCNYWDVNTPYYEWCVTNVVLCSIVANVYDQKIKNSYICDTPNKQITNDYSDTLGVWIRLKVIHTNPIFFSENGWARCIIYIRAILAREINCPDCCRDIRIKENFQILTGLLSNKLVGVFT